MIYLEEIKKELYSRNFNKFFTLWEEYCTSDLDDPKEFIQILKAIKDSDFSEKFGKHVESALPLWREIEDEKLSNKALKLIMDIQTTNSSELAEQALQTLTEKYGEESKFKDWIRLVGLRTKRDFQGALSNFELLKHMEVGNFVYHSGGWGTGEIMKISPIRETLTLEFENVRGVKHVTFKNAFKSLIPLSNEHFLARRFGNPDDLEAEAKKDPIKIIKLFLDDLGPKNASEIKDEMCELVIPEKDWNRWWQATRTKIKKDTMIQNPASLSDSFVLREEEVSHGELLLRELKTKRKAFDILQIAYTYVRDFPQVLKKDEVKEILEEKLNHILSNESTPIGLHIQATLFSEEFLDIKPDVSSTELIKDLTSPAKTIDSMEIQAFKRRALRLINKYREDWASIYLIIFLQTSGQPVRELVFEGLNKGETKEILCEEIEKLIKTPAKHPEVFYWYFQKIVKDSDENLPFGDKDGICRFLESFFVLMHKIEMKPEYRDLVKKMINFITARRFANFRTIIEGTSVDYLKELILLTTKCHSLSNHEKGVLHSLAQVVQPSLGKPKKETSENLIWTTQEGFEKIRDRIKEISTVEMIENAKELEIARAHGDLRENAEYKAAKEKRARLQGEMRMLSQQAEKARLLSSEDVKTDVVNVGCVVKLQSESGTKTSYTILGPWEADTEKNIISFQSKLAQAMMGRKVGETVVFQDQEQKILEIDSFFNT